MADIIKSAIDIITPVIESSMILAGHYAKACGRDCVMAEDVKYAMRYCARNVIGKQIGTLFPELQEEDSEEDEEEGFVDEENEKPFSRYQGADVQLLAINEAHDTWDQWEPFSIMEKMVKNAIDRN